MQSNHQSSDNQTAQLAVLNKNLCYSLQRRLEDLIALSQELLEHLQQSPEKTNHNRDTDNRWVLLEDTLRLAQNDWALLEWLR